MSGAPGGGMPGGGLPGGMPGGAPPAFSIGAPGGAVGPPGGVPPPLVQPLTLLAPLPGAMQAGPLAIAGGGLPGAAVAMSALPAMPGGVAEPLPFSSAPGGGVPGAGMQLPLPDLHAAARAALEGVVEHAPEAPAHAAAPVSTRTQASMPAPPPEAPPIGAQTPHVAAMPVDWAALPPAPAPGSGTRPPAPGSRTAPPAPGVWAAPGPRPTWAPAPRPLPPAPLDRQAWPGAEVVPEERDLGQRVGDRLYPFVERIKDSRLGWVGVVALFGLTVPIMLLRQRGDVRVRLILGAFMFFVWIGLIQDLASG